MKDVLRLLQSLAASSRERAFFCTAKVNGEPCGQPTHCEKPWCSDHVLSHSPYARALHRLELERPTRGINPRHRKSRKPA